MPKSEENKCISRLKSIEIQFKCQEKSKFNVYISKERRGDVSIHAQQWVLSSKRTALCCWLPSFDTDYSFLRKTSRTTKVKREDIDGIVKEEYANGKYNQRKQKVKNEEVKKREKRDCRWWTSIQKILDGLYTRSQTQP